MPLCFIRLSKYLAKMLNVETCNAAAMCRASSSVSRPTDAPAHPRNKCKQSPARRGRARQNRAACCSTVHGGGRAASFGHVVIAHYTVGDPRLQAGQPTAASWHIHRSERIGGHAKGKAGRFLPSGSQARKWGQKHRPGQSRTRCVLKRVRHQHL